MDWANEKLSTDEISNKLLLATDKGERTIFDMTAKRGELEVLQKVWE
jgi:hypothetical protein